ncbi:DUF4397 domain-containing protein [Rhizosphaericola mali]|uniref:DUF4397 domain-containing protein n=1 Tax=Rhizosphaericola mali TaxID=2545455 RepID=A0A5P2FWC2_9BACT|nr:DUF4397 domain-containing protein [Rhizosphaericola mali]QES87826.1 DUF4397 domain-containing protein [Rhizosphaericola mali]
MKKNYRNLFCLIAISLFTFFGCKKDVISDAGYDYVDDNHAYIKVISAAPYYASSIGVTDSIDVYQAGSKLTGASIGYGGLFPYSINPTSTNINNLYSQATIGKQNLFLLYADSSSRIIYNMNFEGGKYYTFLLTDSLNSTDNSKRMVLTDDWSTVTSDTNQFKIRFVNAVSKDSAISQTAVDLYSANDGVIFSNQSQFTSTSFAAANYLSKNDTFYVTRTVSDQTLPLSKRTVLAKLIVPTQSFTVSGLVSKRVYTFYYYGNGTIASGAKARTLGYYINQ